MLRKIIRSLGKGFAVAAAAVIFGASLIAYPFILALFLGYSLYETWADFFTLVKEELQKIVVPAFINRMFFISGSQLQKNIAPSYEPAKMVKNFLQSVGMSLVLPFIALYKVATITFLFAIKNADEVYSNISRFMNFDGGYPSASPRDFRLPVTPVNESNIYQESQQATMLNQHRRQPSGSIDLNTEQRKDLKNASGLKISNQIQQ